MRRGGVEKRSKGEEVERREEVEKRSGGDEERRSGD